MAGEWGRVSRRCQWASGGGTCPMALLQVTLLAWRLGPDGPRGPVQPGRCGGCERWLLPWCLDRAEGSWTAGGQLGLAHRSGRGGAGLRGQTCLAAVPCWFEAPGCAAGQIPRRTARAGKGAGWGL